MAEKLRKITRAYTDLKAVYDDNDLKKAGMSLTDYRECERLMPMLGKPGSIAYTILEKAAGFFKEHGYEIQKSGIGYMIMI